MSIKITKEVFKKVANGIPVETMKPSQNKFPKVSRSYQKDFHKKSQIFNKKVSKEFSKIMPKMFQKEFAKEYIEKELPNDFPKTCHRNS